MRVNVAGGTGAGRKRPLKQAAAWTCACPAPAAGSLFGNLEHPSWRLRCETCGARKP